MRPFKAPALMMALPELALAIAALIFLALAVSTKKESYRLISLLSIFSLIMVGTLVCKTARVLGVTFGGMFIADPFAIYMKLLVVTGSAASLAMAANRPAEEEISRVEYPILVLFSTLGMMLMISANDLISLYVGLELQSLPLYVLAAIRRDSERSTEAGLKYFVLGSLSSGLLLYGASLIYGFAGATGFAQIAEAFHAGAIPLGAITGLVFLIAGMAFKLAAVPFHMWAPDVYEGAPSPVTAFFAIAPKVAAIALFTRVLMGPFGEAAELWRQVIVAISIASMALGGVAAVVQTNIKRLLAYSSIGHMGYALVGIAAGGKMGIQAVLVYIALYMLMSIGVFCVVLMMKRKGSPVENISDLSGLAKQQPMVAFAMALMMFSMAGIPPLAGFFGKLFIFQAAVGAGLYTLSIIGVLTSVVAAYYYLRIIKVMYFEDAAAGIDPAQDRALNAILTLASMAILLFIIFPSPLMNSAALAAQSLIK